MFNQLLGVTSWGQGAVLVNTLVLDVHSAYFLISIIMINVKMLSEILMLNLNLNMCTLTSVCDVSVFNKLIFKCGQLKTVL